MTKIIFFGTDEFAASILKTLMDHGIDVVAVVTKPDRAKARKRKVLPPPVKEWMVKEGIDLPLYQPEKASTQEFALTLEGYRADLFVVVSYGEIISQRLLDIPKILPINIHPSLLPKYRGASPLRSALLNGDKEIGICIIEMVKAMDAGDILALDRFDVIEGECHSDLEKRVFKRSGDLLLNLISEIKAGNLKKTPQSSEVTFTKKFTTQDASLNFNEGVEKTLNTIRAFGEFPGAFCVVEISGKSIPLKILRAKKINDEGSLSPQIKSFSKQEGFVISMPGGSLEVEVVQKPGKNPMPSKDFINGLRSKPPKLLFSS